MKEICLDDVVLFNAANQVLGGLGELLGAYLAETGYDPEKLVALAHSQNVKLHLLDSGAIRFTFSIEEHSEISFTMFTGEYSWQWSSTQN